MRKHDELKDPKSCLNKAASIEPIFVLRANDELAPYLVRAWAEMYRIQKVAEGGMRARQKAKHREALKLADAMEEWKENQ